MYVVKGWKYCFLLSTLTMILVTGHHKNIYFKKTATIYAHDDETGSKKINPEQSRRHDSVVGRIAQKLGFNIGAELIGPPPPPPPIMESTMPEYGWNEYEQLFHETKRSSWSTCARRQLCYCYSRVSNRYFCCDCDNGACFPSLSIVNIKNRGQRYMSQLRVNDFVLTVSDSGETKFTRVLGFLDRRTNVQAAYIHITTASNESLSISRRHLLFVKKTNSTESDLVPIFAGDVRIGDEVIVPQEVHDEGLKTISVKIIKINVNIMEGAFVPVTESGTLLVDDVLVSCYATIDHYVSHMVLAPMRWFPKLFENEESQFNDGIRTYAKILKYFGRKVLPRSLLASDDNEMIIVRRPNIQSSYDIFTEQLLCKFKYFINIIV